MGPLHRGRTDTYQGYSPTFFNACDHGELPVPQTVWGGSRIPLLDFLPLFLFFQLCLLLPQLRHAGPYFFPLRGG